jgi:glycosyltransferase involved in cell wall biosynthesis
MDLPATHGDPGPELRVLFLSTYFPRPLNMLLGPWALSQAQALRRQLSDFRVISLTPWVPKLLARAPGSRAYAYTPHEHRFGDLDVAYPRWLLYPIPPFKHWAFPAPQRQLRLGWWSAARSLRGWIEKTRPEVIFAHHTAVNGYVARQIQKEYGIPYVITDHDFQEITYCEKFPARKALFDDIYSHAAGVVAVSHRMEADMRRIFPRVPACTIHNGIDPIPSRLFTIPRPRELAGRKIIFSAGMFYERKGLRLLIEAFGTIAARHPNALLRIAGDGAERGKIEATIRAGGLGERVQLLGKVPREVVLQEMVWSDGFALVGWDEPFATVFIEAMGAGKPILCASDGGITDVVRDGVHGWIIPPRQLGPAGVALDAMLGNDSARLRMGAAARALVAEKLTWDANAAAMLALFRRAAAAKGASLHVTL